MAAYYVAKKEKRLSINWGSLIAGIAGAAINFVEQIHDSKQGQTKFGMAVNITQTAATIAAAAGVISPDIAGDIGKIGQIVQAEFDKLKSTGTLARPLGGTVAPVSGVSSK